MKLRKGTRPFPSSFKYVMQAEDQIRIIEEKVNSLLAAHPSHFLVEVRIKPTNNVKVFIDADEGVILSELIEYNRKLYKQLEESGLFPDGDFSLEVSSPGLDEPLKLFRQYKKNVGRFVDITFNDSTKKEGKLVDATEDGIVIETETGKGKKKETKQESILFDQIKNTKIQVKF
jgi:ribosome maturation factor RimP